MIEETVLALPTLRGRHLSRTFGEGDTETTALFDVSLDLYPGQIALLMGPSGSGKSTLLAVLSGLLHPTGGQVQALNEDLWKMSERQRERFRLKHVGFIFQGYNLFPALTAPSSWKWWCAGARGPPAATPAAAPTKCWACWDWGRRLACGRPRCPAARSSAWPSAAPSSRTRISCSPTSRPAPWTGTTASRWWNSCGTPPTNGEATILVVAHDSRIIPHVDRVYYLEDGSLRDSDMAPLSPPHVEAPAGCRVCISLAAGRRPA